MNILKSMAVAFSTYSKIPMPQFEWKEENMRYSMCFFPVIGAVIGVLLMLLDFLMGKLQFGSGFRSAVYTVLPLLVTGGIHLDGYMDTTDALRSYRGKEERLRILKDPHIGAFAVIRALILLILTYGLYTEAGHEILFLVSFSFVISRCLSGLAVIRFPKAKKDGMVYTVSDAAKSAQRRVFQILVAELAASAAGMIVTGITVVKVADPGRTVSGLIPAIAALGAAGALYAYYYHMAIQKFGGTSGDLAGWFLTVCEFFMLLVIILSNCLLQVSW